jgi:spore germination protein KA
MFSYLFRKMGYWLLQSDIQPNSEAEKTIELLTASLSANLDHIKREFSDSPDLVIKEFRIELLKSEACLVYMNGLIKESEIEAKIITALTHDIQIEGRQTPQALLELLSLKAPVSKIGFKNEVSEIRDSILAGDTVLLSNGLAKALIFDTKGGATRAINEPVNEALVKGSHEGFVESLPINITLLRRRINNSNLVFNMVRLGKKTRTEVGIAYLKGVADERLVAEVHQRIKRINCDQILGTQDIEEYIMDTPFSPFRTIAYSERPEVVAAKVLEGKVGLLVNGTPVVLTMPMFFIESLQNPDDYHVHFYYGTLLRWLRFLAYFLSIFSPALYVALLTFHLELIPSPLLITLVSMEKNVPFSPVMEALLMGVIVEILRMGGIWLPRMGREVVSILVLMLIGLALVTSNLVAVPFVVVVAITQFASFTIPFQEEASAFVRLFLVVLAGSSGLFGVLIGSLVILMHLISLRSFGLPYLAPLTPFNPQKLKDSLIRAPAWLVNHHDEREASEKSDYQMTK